MFYKLNPQTPGHVEAINLITGKRQTAAACVTAKTVLAGFRAAWDREHPPTPALPQTFRRLQRGRTRRRPHTN